MRKLPLIAAALVASSLARAPSAGAQDPTESPLAEYTRLREAREARARQDLDNFECVLNNNDHLRNFFNSEILPRLLLILPDAQTARAENPDHYLSMLQHVLRSLSSDVYYNAQSMACRAELGAADIISEEYARLRQLIDEVGIEGLEDLVERGFQLPVVAYLTREQSERLLELAEALREIGCLDYTLPIYEPMDNVFFDTDVLGTEILLGAFTNEEEYLPRLATEAECVLISDGVEAHMRSSDELHFRDSRVNLGGLFGDERIFVPMSPLRVHSEDE